MQLADEELRDVLGEILLHEGPPRHPQARQRIECGHLVAQRLQDARERTVAGRQRSGLAIDGPQGAMVEMDAPTCPGDRIDVGLSGLNAVQQVCKQQSVERHRDLGPTDLSRF